MAKRTGWQTKQEEQLALLKSVGNALPPMMLVQLAHDFARKALSQGLPFPVDVDGEAFLRQAVNNLKKVLDEENS